MTLIPKVSFRCVKCWKYSPKIKCYDCFPSPCFPLYCEKKPPDMKKNFTMYKKWDDWYIWRYLLEQDEDPEAIYQIGSHEMEEEHHRIKSIEKMKKMTGKRRMDRFKYVACINLGMSSVFAKAKYRFAKKAKHI